MGVKVDGLSYNSRSRSQKGAERSTCVPPRPRDRGQSTGCFPIAAARFKLSFGYLPVVGLVDESLDLGVSPRPSALKGVLYGRGRHPIIREPSVFVGSTRVHGLDLGGRA